MEDVLFYHRVPLPYFNCQWNLSGHPNFWCLTVTDLWWLLHSNRTHNPYPVPCAVGVTLLHFPVPYLVGTANFWCLELKRVTVIVLKQIHCGWARNVHHLTFSILDYCKIPNFTMAINQSFCIEPKLQHIICWEFATHELVGGNAILQWF